MQDTASITFARGIYFTTPTTKAAAPVLATSNAVSNAVSNANTTNNNYNGSTGETKVNINFANSRFKDFFDVEVENSIGRAARKAVI